MAGVEVEKIVPNTEDKSKTTSEPTSEAPKETTVNTDDSTIAVEVEIKEGEEDIPKVEKETEIAPAEVPAAVEEKDVKPMAQEEKAVDVKTV